MFTYVCFGTNDIARAARFYDAVLAALGLKRCDTSSEQDWGDWIGWGTYNENGREEIALWVCRPHNGNAATSGNGTMVALKARTWKEVQAAHRAALQAGDRAKSMKRGRTRSNVWRRHGVVTAAHRFKTT